jgi:murein DD-endopeptidase MepM/ murein hydrolase activator NlpD
MIADRNTIRSLGNEPPILADGRRAPDRREISLRWLSGTFLTGITSSILMGVALFAALDGRQQLAIPAEAFAKADMNSASADVTRRGGRILESNIAARPSDRSVLEVSTVIHDGDKEVVRRVPFAHVKIALASNYATQDDYPAFDPLNIFAANGAPPPAASRTGTIYGSDVESEVSLRTVAFPLKNPDFAYAGAMSIDEVEEAVRSNGSILTDGNEQLAALYYIDPRRFDTSESDVDITAGLSARVVEQNMSVSTPQTIVANQLEYADDVIPVRQVSKIAELLGANGYSKEQADTAANSLEPLLRSAELAPGDVLRVGILQGEGESAAKIVRASVYRKNRHDVTVAVNDKGQFVEASEPPKLDAVASAFESNPAAAMANRDLPRVYDGIYRASLAYGMNKDMIGLMIKLLASSVDFQAQLRPTDTLEAFFSVQDKEGKATDDSELLYVNAKFGDNETRFYRFQNPEDNSVDYFNEDGKSIRQFLIRNPVPNGRMTSGFGMRRHPVLRFSRMHTGTDWAAPRGTPIIATGNGVVEKAGWANGYGNQTLIRHANGYVSSYNHQSAIAKGVKEGARVTQGQVIGYVGSTGLSTGAHLHYELIVNGTKVDAMKVRLPGGKSLSGDALARFTDERQRIDALLDSEGKPEQVASR